MAQYMVRIDQIIEQSLERGHYGEDAQSSHYIQELESLADFVVVCDCFRFTSQDTKKPAH